MSIKSMRQAGLILLASSASAMAAPVNELSNVVFIVDESTSMSADQDFLETVVIDKLDQDLADEGVITRKYGVVGYGGSISAMDPRAVGGTDLTDAADAKINIGALTSLGAIEDGYEAMQFALDNLNFDDGAAINFILVTDEDRDSAGGPDQAELFAALTEKSVLLNAIVNVPLGSDGGEALGIDASGDAYLADGMGDYLTASNGVMGNGVGNTETAYGQLALDTGGAVWSLNMLRSGGLDTVSFTEAFIDIKVREITTQDPAQLPSPSVPPSAPVTAPVPLPAAAWLMIAGLGGLGALKRIRARA